MSAMGDRLRAGRELKGYTQQEFADLLGVHRASISNWENGVIPKRHLARVRKELGLDEQLRPLDAPAVTRPRDMDSPELMSEFNTAISRVTELASEINHRMTGAEPNVIQRKPARRPPRHAHESPTAVYFASLDDEQSTDGYAERSND